MSIFIDTNILVYAINKDSPYHIVGRGILDDAKENNIRAQEFFDVLIVATMLDNDIDTIYTANEDDFSKYNEINVYNPFRKK